MDWIQDVVKAAGHHGFSVHQRRDGRWVLHKASLYVVLGETPEGLKELTEFLSALRAAGVSLNGNEK